MGRNNEECLGYRLVNQERFQWEEKDEAKKCWTKCAVGVQTDTGWEGLFHFANSKQFIVSGKSSLTRGVARVHTRNDGQSMIMQSLYIMWRNLNFMLKLRRGDLAKHVFGNNRSDNSSAGPRFCGAW